MRSNFREAFCRWPRCVAIAAALLAIAAVGRAEPLRVQSIGDSITAGYTDNPVWNVGFEFGYRSGVYQSLTQAGVDFQLVGESTEPWISPFAGDPTRGGTYTPPLDLRDFGHDHHRGYGGVAAPFVLQRIGDTPQGPGWLTVDDPDLVLVHLGTNGQLPNELDAILDLITTERPGVAIVLAQIIPKRDYLPSIVAYNTFLEGRILPKYEARGANVTLVDHHTPFLTNPTDPTSINTSLFATGNHPNAAGYGVMAATWFGAIQSVLDAPSLTGDYNADGAVDAADYSLWRERLGQNRNTLANRSPDNTGVINTDDLLAWQEAYGSVTVPAATPEPHAALLASLAIVASQLRRRKQA